MNVEVMAERTTTGYGKIITLRCCRHWPAHVSHAYGYGGRCGLCGQQPEVVEKEYRS